MALHTVSDFVGCLRNVRLLEPEQQNALAAELLSRFAEPKALASELIRRGWMTPYQANLLLQGRGGELILGSYVLLERIGEGGMGQVFKAKNWKLGRIVALKLIRKERLANDDAVRRFHREIRAAAVLSHPNIVAAYDADEVNGTHFFAMECVEGSDLAKLIKQHGPMPVAQACDCVRQAAVGLQHAHERGMVHRDIKPHNLLLTKQGVVKILDMGLARLTHAGEDGEASTTMTQEGAVMGTPDYMAPEQAEESHTVDIRADLYSLGCTLYQLLTGKVPFPGGTLIQKLKKHQSNQPTPIEACRSDVPPAVCAVVYKLMAKRPEERYQTPAELVRALEALPGEDSRTLPSAVQAAQAILPMHDTINEALDFRPTDEAAEAMMAEQRSRRQTEKRKLLLAAVGGGVLLLGLAVALWLLVGRSGRPLPEVQPVAGEQPQARKKEKRSFEQWLREVADLPAEEQVKAVAKKLQERNPGFDGKVTHKLWGSAVAELQFVTDEVTDISPVRALTRLKDLRCTESGYSKGKAVGRGKLADLWPLKGLPLLRLDCSFNEVADLRPLEGMSLDNLSFHSTKVADLSPLKGVALNGYLGFSGTLVSDLSPLQGMPLRVLNLNGRPITDLRPLQGMPLEALLCRGAKVSDVSPLRGMPLKEIEWDFKPERDTEALRSIKTLEKINDQPIAEFWKEADGERTAFEQWTASVQKLPADKQAEAVAAELKKRNPGFDGKVTHKIEDGRVTSLEFCTDAVTDVAPVRALAGLNSLNASGSDNGKGKLADLWPLRGLPLSELAVSNNKGLADLTPLRAMRLKSLSCYWTDVADLRPLRGMELSALGVGGTQVADLSSLQGMKLQYLSICFTRVTDLSLLKDMPLTDLQIQDIFNRERDSALLHSLKTLKTIDGKPATEFWKNVSDPLKP